MITCPRVLCKYRSSTGQVEIMMEGGMTMAGRKPKPTAIKKLEGNPGKRKLNTKEPIPAKGMPECPQWLLAEAKKEWERLADLMNQMNAECELNFNNGGDRKVQEIVEAAATGSMTYDEIMANWTELWNDAQSSLGVDVTE